MDNSSSSPVPHTPVSRSSSHRLSYGTLMGPFITEAGLANERCEEEEGRTVGAASLEEFVNDPESDQASREAEDEFVSKPYVESWWNFVFAVGPVTVAVIWVLIGVAVLVWVLDWHTITAFYVITQVVTTIGYGDHTPLSQAGKMFVTLYSVGTILLIGTLLTEMMSSVVHQNLVRVEKLMGYITWSSTPTFKGTPPYQRLMAAFSFFAVFIVLGTVFFGTYEACSCSYGIDRIQGCVDALCRETGGDIKTWVDCFYLSVVTLTTCGFGDQVPLSKCGRVFLIPWSFIGTISMANFAAKFGELLWSLREDQKAAQNSTQDILDRIDQEEPGQLTKHEFLEFALIKFNLITEDALDNIEKAFEKLDKDTTGTVSTAEILKAWT